MYRRRPKTTDSQAPHQPWHLVDGDGAADIREIAILAVVCDRLPQAQAETVLLLFDAQHAHLDALPNSQDL